MATKPKTPGKGTNLPPGDPGTMPPMPNQDMPMNAPTKPKKPY